MTTVGAVRAWEGALNRGDAEGVLRLSAPDVEIVGPRGVASGREALRGWLAATRVSLHPRRTFAAGDAVAVVHLGVWRSPETGETVGEAEVVSTFRVAAGRVRRYARFDALADALADAGLSEADEEPA